MAKSSSGVYLNENQAFMMGILSLIKALRNRYRSLPDDIEECDRLVNRIKGLLRSESVGKVLGAMLADQRASRRALLLEAAHKEWVEGEQDLGAHFGYSSREVKRYVQYARERAHRPESPSNAGITISTAEDLVKQLDTLHARAKQASIKTSPIASLSFLTGGDYRTRKRARREAQDGLYWIGTIVADTMARHLFGVSYTVALAGLSEDPGDD